MTDGARFDGARLDRTLLLPLPPAPPDRRWGALAAVADSGAVTGERAEAAGSLTVEWERAGLGAGEGEAPSRACVALRVMAGRPVSAPSATCVLSRTSSERSSHATPSSLSESLPEGPATAWCTTPARACRTQPAYHPLLSSLNTLFATASRSPF